ncbi:MAG TPA: flagellar motor protein MotA [Kiloniellales bacterium]|nr:flagellar motor protein MotA [Kiloniellales bacterium]
MNRPQRYLIRMTLFLLIVAAACAALAPRLQEAFTANVLLNGMILGVLLLGIIYIFRQVATLKPEVDWLANLRRESQGGVIYADALSAHKPPRLLGPMAKMLGERRGRISLSTLSMRTVLDGIQSRIEESHDISRYLIGLLIFLGLLGTFWGLIETVTAVGRTINSLSGTAADPAALFEQLQRGLETPLSGMGTAFSSSLFGLGGSLILGFLELQAGQAHNRFLNDLEEWLSSVTRLSSGGSVGEGEQSVPAFIQALLEKTADSLDQLQHTIARGEGERNSVNQNLLTLTERIGTLTDQMRAEQGVLIRLADMQSQMKTLLSQLGDKEFGGGLDEATRSHIRNLDVRLENLLKDLSNGRDYTVQEIRGEIRLLTRTIAAMAEEGD